MKTLRVVLIALIATAAMASDTQQSFDTLKTLSGSWAGKGSQGQPVQVSYRVTSGGSALMSEIKSEDDMISMFHMDGNRLLLTHYCGAGNQPRMHATSSPDGKIITFDFLDATNLSRPQAGHMHHVVITMPDANRHTEEWTFMQDGKEMKELFELTRKK